MIDLRTTGIHAPTRLSAALRLGPVTLAVSDLQRSKDFYVRVLGFQVLRESEGSLALGAGAAVLVRLEEKPGIRAARPGSRLGLFHVAYLLPTRGDLGRFVRHVLEMGIRPGMSDHLVSEAVYLSDPDGHGIEVYADRPRASWDLRGNEIAMDTRPLDVQSVLADGGDEGWTGMPEGAVIGHVHLSVDDLRRAEAFYHELLGFDKVVWSYPGALFLSAGGYHHHLGLNTWARDASVAGAEDARLLEWSIELPTRQDVADSKARLRDAGRDVTDAADGWSVEDPWGVRVRVFRRTPEGVPDVER
jgi:catechol 2,3-dioxygenase